MDRLDNSSTNTLNITTFHEDTNSFNGFVILNALRPISQGVSYIQNLV